MMRNQTIKHRFGFFCLFLITGLLVSFFPMVLSSTVALLITQPIISVILLFVASFLRKKQSNKSAFQVAFAFFILSFCFLVLYVLQYSGLFSLSTVNGQFVFQMANASAIFVSVVLLTKVSGLSMGEIYLKRGRLKLGLGVGATIFVVMVLLIVAFPSGLSMLFPVSDNITREKVLALLPLLTIYVLSNGLREEPWFRGIFLKKLEPFIGFDPSNFVTSIVFALSHIGANYTPAILVFLGIVFVLGLAFGYMMRKTDSVIGSAIFHAAMDIPVVLGYWSFL